MTDYCEFCEKNLTAYAKKCWNCKRIFNHADYVHFGRPDKDPEIEPYTIVKLVDDSGSLQHLFEPNDKTFLYIHDLSNMKGHCYVIGLTTGKNYIGIHTDNFVEVDENDI